MNYSYTVHKADSENQTLLIKYSATDKSDYFKSFRCDDFSDAGIQQIAEGHSDSVVAFWEREGQTNDATGKSFSAVHKSKIYQDPPAFDPVTQELEPRVVETATTITHSYIIKPRSADDIRESKLQQRYREYPSIVEIIEDLMAGDQLSPEMKARVQAAQAANPID